MTDRPTGYGAPPAVLPPNPGPVTVRGPRGGVRLPWLVTLVVLLAFSALVAALLARGGAPAVPDGVLDARASVTHATAQSVRKGLDEAVDDLAVLAATLAQTEEREWDARLAGFLEAHTRYPLLYVVGLDGVAQHVVGTGEPRPEALPQPLPRTRGLLAPVAAGSTPLLLAYTPLRGPDAAPLLLVGRYDVAFLRAPLGQVTPGDAYVVDREARVVGATAGFRALQDLPGDALTPAAQRALAGERVLAQVVEGRVVTASPVAGSSPAGALGLAVVAEVDQRLLSLPRYEARRLALLLGALAGLLSLLSMFWFYLAVVGPVRRLTADAERVAYGDRRVPVHVRRYDEVGLVARAVERCRVLLVSSPGRS